MLARFRIKLGIRRRCLFSLSEIPLHLCSGLPQSVISCTIFHLVRWYFHTGNTLTASAFVLWFSRPHIFSFRRSCSWTMDPFTIEVFTLWGVSAMVIGLRTYARWSTVGIREFQVDDYLMIVACVSSPFFDLPLLHQ